MEHTRTDVTELKLKENIPLRHESLQTCDCPRGDSTALLIKQKGNVIYDTMQPFQILVKSLVIETVL